MRGRAQHRPRQPGIPGAFRGPGPGHEEQENERELTKAALLPEGIAEQEQRDQGGETTAPTES